jgi:hypothetical protein
MTYRGKDYTLPRLFLCAFTVASFFTSISESIHEFSAPFPDIARARMRHIPIVQPFLEVDL